MRVFFLLLFALFLSGCGAQMRNLPVGKGNLQVSGSVGGPLVKAFGMTVPVPYAMGGVTYGLTDRVDLHGDLHLLAAAYKLAGITPGITWFPPLLLKKWTPSIGADLLLFSDFSQSRVFPEITTAIAHQGFGKWQPYAGVRHTFQTYRSPHYIPSLYLGASWKTERAKLYFELDYLAADRDNRWTPVEYQGINHRGALAPKLGISFDWPGRGK